MSVSASIASAIISSVLNAIADAPPSAPPAVPVQMGWTRVFPEGTQKGELLPPVQQRVSINGRIMPAAPGLQIRNEQNLIVLPGTLVQPVTVPVRYQLDLMGNVWRIWILSAAEQAVPDLKK